MMNLPVLGPWMARGPVPELHQSAAELCSDVSLPTSRDEEWRYIPMRLVSEIAWKQAEAAATPDLSLLPFESVLCAVMVDGVFRPELSHGLAELSIGPTQILADHVGKLARLETTEFSVAAHRGKLRKPGVDLFARLNTAQFSEGIALHLKKNQVVSEPILLVNISTQAETVTCPRITVVAEAGAQASIVELHWSATDGPTLSFPVVECWVEPQAHLEWVKVQAEGPEARHIALNEFSQTADSELRHVNITLGGLLTRNDTNVTIGGSNALTRLDGIVCLEENQLADNHTRLDHQKPHCESHEVYKHLLNGESTAVFNGKIFVHQDAQKTDAKQTNQAILLSPTATMNSKPQLEIFADDVKCTHGATVGQLESSMEFYLRSRGISATEARSLLTLAFVGEVLDLIQVESVRETVGDMLRAKLLS